MTSQFAVRVAVLSGIALVAFAIIFFRLWYLEVLSGEEYRAQAENNRVREFTVQAPRGEILDSEGRTLVENRTALSLQIRPDQLPKNTRRRNDLLKDLAKKAPVSYEKIKRAIRRQEVIASPVTVARDVDNDLVYYLREREDQFPGVTAEEISVREYPKGTLAAHLFGFVAEIGEAELDQPQYEGLNPGDQIGRAGVEAQYDKALRGRNGAIAVPVDAFGNPRGRQISETPPETGNDLVLTIDAKLQAAAESALQAHAGGKPGAFVVMRPEDGAILAMGSTPTFDPSIYTPPVSFEKIEALNEAEGDPLVDKATLSQYPTGSTFKAISGTAGLEEGLVTPSTVISDTGSFEYGGRDWINAGEQAYGSVDLGRALEVSSDIYFYLLGRDADFSDNQEAIQDWAKKFGFGSPTGIDLPTEAGGQVPTPEWRNQLYEQFTDPDSECGREAVFDPARDCYETVDRPWVPGDNMNLAVGQGDLLATPLQLATAYAALANDGTVVRPHVAKEVRNQLGQVEETFTPAPRRELGASPATLASIRDGIHRAATGPEGTSNAIFGNYPIDVAGKTGTAETPKGDQSWYASWAPFSKPEIVVAATVEGGGFGSETAAPIVRDIYNHYFKVNAAKLDPIETQSGAVE